MVLVTRSNKMVEIMEIVNPEHTTTIPEFYKGKNVFITGATGFLGKMFIDKLLRCCPDIGNVYILVRPKKGKDIKERVEQILEDLLFDTLKETRPLQLSKLIPLRGDCSQIKLGLSEADYQTVTSSVSVIYHVAASVRFDDALKYAILLNTRGTRELALLALQTTRLSVLVHVSTTFCNCVVGREIFEELYPAPDDWRKAIKIAEEMDEGQLASLQDKYLGSYPNTYTFTKALGEHVIKDLCEGKISTIICRPSVVISTLKDPVAGWIDNFNGPVGLLIAGGKGLLRCSYLNPNIHIDYMPVDIIVKSIIVAAWDLGLRQQQSQIEVMNCSNGFTKLMSFGELIDVGQELNNINPFNDVIWMPKGNITRSRVYAYICTILFHLLPAFFLDMGLKLSGKKMMLMKLQTKIYNAALQLRYFSFQEWHFLNEKLIALQKKILDKDEETWGFDISSVEPRNYLENALMGSRKYLLHEFDESLPQARIHHNRMYWLDKVTMFILYGSLFWLVIHFGFIGKIFYIVKYYITYLFDGKMV